MKREYYYIAGAAVLGGVLLFANKKPKPTTAKIPTFTVTLSPKDNSVVKGKNLVIPVTVKPSLPSDYQIQIVNATAGTTLKTSSSNSFNATFSSNKVGSYALSWKIVGPASKVIQKGTGPTITVKVDPITAELSKYSGYTAQQIAAAKTKAEATKPTTVYSSGGGSATTSQTTTHYPSPEYAGVNAKQMAIDKAKQLAQQYPGAGYSVYGQNNQYFVMPKSGATAQLQKIAAAEALVGNSSSTSSTSTTSTTSTTTNTGSSTSSTSSGPTVGGLTFTSSKRPKNGDPGFIVNGVWYSNYNDIPSSQRSSATGLIGTSYAKNYGITY